MAGSKNRRAVPPGKPPGGRSDGSVARSTANAGSTVYANEVAERFGGEGGAVVDQTARDSASAANLAISNHIIAPIRIGVDSALAPPSATLYLGSDGALRVKHDNPALNTDDPEGNFV